jgi:endonuclease/exonuclease/phosphatase family metal-dependent hydrolase
MTSFYLSTVYGPSRRAEKESFLLHLRHLKPPDDTRWLIIGDFNLIYKASDKNNRNLSISLMSRFRRAIDHCQLKEINLQNRKFTWSSERRRPTLVRLDRAFCNQEWDLTFGACSLHALSSTHSDHCPLLLSNHSGPRRSTPFKFENF